MQSRILVLAALSAAFVAWSGCATLRVAREPMRSVEHAPIEASASERVVILLPGLGDRPKHFERNGFVDMIHAADPGARVIAVDAHFGYYRNRTAIDRLYEDVLEPARRSGASEVWVVGISMGGAGAAGLAEAHGDQIDGVILLAPYLGGGAIADEVAGAGGLGPWERHTRDGQGDRERYFRDIWAWLDGYTTGATRPDLHIGIGDQDRGIRAATLVGEVLGDGAYATLEGGHDWRVWRPLFSAFSAEAFADPPGDGPGETVDAPPPGDRDTLHEGRAPSDDVAAGDEAAPSAKD